MVLEYREDARRREHHARAGRDGDAAARGGLDVVDEVAEMGSRDGMHVTKDENSLGVRERAAAERVEVRRRSAAD